MNTANCPAGWATDQIFVFNATEGTCDMSVPLYVAVGVFLTILKGILAYLHVKAWQRRQRKLYAKLDRRRHYPIVPSFSILGFIVYVLFFSLTIANVINAENGWSFAIHSVGWSAFGVISIFFFLKIVRLGRKLIPVLREKRMNEMLEQMQRDEDDPPTYNSTTARNARTFGSFASNPMYDEDPPTYDENSSQAPLPYDGSGERHHLPHIFPHHRQLFGQGMANGKMMIEKKMANGRIMIGNQVRRSRNLFSSSKRAKSPSMSVATLNRKPTMDPPPKNPMWEEDPPTTYSILDIVEPQIDRLKRLDVFGQLFFINGSLAVAGQFIIFFFLLTIAFPNDYYVAKIGFAFQAFFLFQHMVSMNWQFARVIYAVRESRRQSRKNPNIETGLRKIRTQQLTIFLMTTICAVIYVIQATGTVPPFWYYQIIIMAFEVLGNAIIYRTLSGKLKSKINEMKRAQKAQKAQQKANNNHNNNNNNGTASPGGNGGNGNNGGGGGGQAAHANTNHAQNGTPTKKNGNNHQVASPANPDGPAYKADTEERKPKVIKSSVAHVRESAAFVTESSRWDDDNEEEDHAKSKAPSF